VSMISNSGSDPDLRFWPTALRMSSGVIVWVLHFTAIYAFTALACARGFGGATFGAVAAATALAAVLALVIIVKNFDAEFTRWLTAAIAGAALVAILWEGMTALLVPNPCA
jgi:NO-binding membrane sensor protein with MHYT domain